MVYSIRLGRPHRPIAVSWLPWLGAEWGPGWSWSHNSVAYTSFSYWRTYEGGPKRMALPSGGWALCSTGFPHLVRVLGTHLYQCISWHYCERLCSASVNFCQRLSTCLPTPCCVQQFLTPPNHMIPMPHPPYLLILPQATFFVSLMKKVLKGKRFAMWKRWNKKQQK